MIKNIAEILIERANKASKIQDLWITYGDLGKELKDRYKINIGNLKSLGTPLGELSQLCYQKFGLPHISCMVINKDKWAPGPGFFEMLAASRGIKKIAKENRDIVWRQELNAVLACNDWQCLLDHLNNNQLQDRCIKMDTGNKINSNDESKVSTEDRIEFEEDITYSEGKTKITTNTVKVRSSVAPKIAKAVFKSKNEDKLFCQICGFNFFDVYGQVGNDYIEAHHINYLSITGEIETRLEDLIMLCANCHRIIHRSNVSVDELRKIVVERRLNKSELRDRDKHTNFESEIS